MSDIFHTLTYACTIRNSVTGPLVRTNKNNEAREQTSQRVSERLMMQSRENKIVNKIA
jgi:hypothetical protein